MIGETNARIEVAGHAFQRAQQRGVSRNAIYWTIEYGQSVRAVGGAVRRTLTRDSASRMIESGIPAAEASKCLGTVVMTKETDSGGILALTVRPTEKDGRRRGGKHKPRYSNQRPLEMDGIADCTL